MSEQERTPGEEQNTEEQIQDLDVAEEQQDDVLGGAMKKKREDRRA